MGSPNVVFDATPCVEHTIQVDDERTIIANQRGKVVISGRVIENVVVVPGIARTLLSVSALFEGLHVEFTKSGCQVYGAPIFSGVVSGGIYVVIEDYTHDKSALAANGLPQPTVRGGLEHWHLRLGHLNNKSILELERSGKATGLRIVGPRSTTQKCVSCALSKVTTRPAPRTATRPQRAEDEVCHVDLAGPFKRSIHGKHYFMALKWLGYTHVYFLKRKSETAAALKTYINTMNRHHGRKIPRLLILRSDNGGEFESPGLQQLCADEGIDREFSEPHAHYQNGVVERTNRTLTEAARTLLVHADLPHNLWEYAVRSAVYPRNRVVSRSYPSATPFERYHGRPPDLRHLRVFGEPAVYKLPESKRSTRYKFRARGQRGVFVGNDNERKGYFIYTRTGGARIIRTCDVVFLNASPTNPAEPHDSEQHEGELPMTIDRSVADLSPPATPNAAEPDADSAPSTTMTDSALGGRSSELAVTDSPRGGRSTEPAVTDPPQTDRSLEPAATEVPPCQPLELLDRGEACNSDQLTDEEVAAINGTSELTQPRRSERISSRRIGDGLALLVLQEVIDEPITLSEAKRSKFWPLWKKAIEEEIASLRANDTFEVVDPPPGAQVIGCTVKFRAKRDGNCNIGRLRARLCAQGFSQVYLVDYGETFAPVARLVSVRVFLAMVTQLGLRVCQCYVPSAYVKANLDTVIYMKQLPGFEIGDSSKVWKLKKALYGLKQAGKEWNDELNSFLVNYGLRPSREDACVYTMDACTLIVVLYVDDLLIGYADEASMTKLVEAMYQKYQVKCLGDVSCFLGMRINVDAKAGITTIDQYQFAEETLRKLRMENSKPAKTPRNPGTILLKGEEDEALADHVPYRAAVGALLYLSRVSRPDIGFAVNQVAAHASRPTVNHWNAVNNNAICRGH